MLYYDPFVIASTVSCIMKIGYSVFSRSHGSLGYHINQRFVQYFHTQHKFLKCNSVMSPLDYLQPY